MTAEEPRPDTVVALLHDIRNGDRAALDRLLAVAYAELRGIASAECWATAAMSPR